MTSDHFTAWTPLAREHAEPFEVGTVQWVRRPGDGGREVLSSGFWFVTPDEAPAPMDVVSHADETAYIVEGRVLVRADGGEEIELVAGSAASFDKGTTVTWTVLEPSVKFFVYS